MKWWRTYLITFSLETLALLVVNIRTGSAASERVIFNLSLNRLILVFFLVILLAGAGYLYHLTIKQKRKVIEFLNDSTGMFLIVVISFLALALDLFLLSLNSASLGDYAQVYLNFKPFLIWGFIVSAQSWLFSIVWFGHILTGSPHQDDPGKFADELMIVLGIFVLLVAAKMALVLPTAYGPVIRGDEMRYFEMANYLYFGNFFIENINHSPFLYPLMLSVAFAFGEHTYDVIKLLNVLYSSSIVFPMFLISRKYFSKKNALLVTAVACVIPFHFLFPRVIMSENLFFPILLWVIFFILHQPQLEKLALPWNMLTGVAIGLLYMTRYITLAIIPLLLIAWWLIYPDGNRKVFYPSRKKLFAGLLLGIGVILGYSPWLFSGLHAGVPFQTLLGFDITANTTVNQLTLSNLLIWLTLYLCYFVLMASPVLPLFFIFPMSQFKNWEKKTRDWYILTAALLIGFLAACVRHSWRALYNGEIPNRIMGRYILYFTPLFVIAAILAVKEARGSRKSSRNRHLLVSVAFPFALVTLAHQVLLGNLFHFHDGDLINILGSADAAYFQYLGIYFFVLLLFIYGVLSYLTWRQDLPDLIPINLAAVILFFLAGMPAYYQDLLSYQRYQYIGTEIVEMHQTSAEFISDNLKIITPSDATEWDRALLSNTLHFYNLEDLYVDSIENFSINKISEENSDLQAVIIVKVKEESDLLKFPEGEALSFGNDYFIILH